MDTNVIIQELRARAALGWNPEQQAWFDQQAKDARPVQCVRMRDAFTPEQLQFLFKNTGYKTQQKMCYRNAAQLVERAKYTFPLAKRPEKPVFRCPQYHFVAKESGKQYWDVRSLSLIKLNHARINPGVAVKIPM